MFQVKVLVSEGVNFPYYVMGKAQLRIAPFTDPWVWPDASSDPFECFVRMYGTVQVCLPDIEDAWYDWLSATIVSSPESAPDCLPFCSDPLRKVAEPLVPEFLSAWPAIQADLSDRTGSALRQINVCQMLRDNEALFGLTYPTNGEKVFYVCFFPTLAAQQPGPHFVLGSACLSDPASLAKTIRGELGASLLEQLLQDDAIRLILPVVEFITRRDRDVRGGGALLEAVNQVVRAVQGDGEPELERLRKPEAEGHWRLVESLYQHRHLLQDGLSSFVVASVNDLRR
jgi:hypothetical protein